MFFAVYTVCTVIFLIVNVWLQTITYYSSHALIEMYVRGLGSNVLGNLPEELTPHLRTEGYVGMF